MYCAAKAPNAATCSSTQEESLPSSLASSDATAGDTATAARAFNNSARVRRDKASSTVRDISCRAAHTTSAAIYGKSGCSLSASSGFSFVNCKYCRRIRSIHRQSLKLTGVLKIAMNVRRSSHTWTLVESPQSDRMVHAVLGHVPISSPLSTRDRQQTRCDRYESYSRAKSLKSCLRPRQEPSSAAVFLQRRSEYPRA